MFDNIVSQTLVVRLPNKNYIVQRSSAVNKSAIKYTISYSNNQLEYLYNDLMAPSSLIIFIKLQNGCLLAAVIPWIIIIIMDTLSIYIKYQLRSKNPFNINLKYHIQLVYEGKLENGTITYIVKFGIKLTDLVDITT